MTQQKTIYEQHDASFSHVSAYVITKDNERVATIAFKYPMDGAGRLYAYVHWLGSEMVRGSATGYDKTSAACEDAASKMNQSEYTEAHLFVEALSKDGGFTWNYRLELAGFTVLQAV